VNDTPPQHRVAGPVGEVDVLGDDAVPVRRRRTFRGLQHGRGQQLAQPFGRPRGLLQRQGARQPEQRVPDRQAEQHERQYVHGRQRPGLDERAPGDERDDQQQYRRHQRVRRRDDPQQRRVRRGEQGPVLVGGAGHVVVRAGQQPGVGDDRDHHGRQHDQRERHVDAEEVEDRRGGRGHRHGQVDRGVRDQVVQVLDVVVERALDPARAVVAEPSQRHPRQAGGHLPADAQLEVQVGAVADLVSGADEREAPDGRDRSHGDDRPDAPGVGVPVQDGAGEFVHRDVGDQPGGRPRDAERDREDEPAADRREDVPQGVGG
jgi:hypothetical protein